MAPYQKGSDPVGQRSCVYVAKIEQFALCECVCECVCARARYLTHTNTWMCEGGRGTGWENTPMCGLTKLSFCP